MTAVAGGADRVRIVLDGHEIEVAGGVSVAAALLLAGVGEFRRTPRGDAPRTVFCGMGSCYDCVLRVDGVGSVRSCITEIAAGMVISTTGTEHGDD